MAGVLPLGDEKKRLLFDPEAGYGTLPSFSDKRRHEDDKPARAGFFGLFRFTTKTDIFLIWMGSVFSILHGACFPILAIIFGQMTNLFIQKQNEPPSPPDGPVVRTVNDIITHQTLMYQNFSVPIGRLKMEDNFTTTMMSFSLFYLYICFFVLFTSFLQTWCWETSSYRQGHKLRQAFLSQILRQDAAWYDTHAEGDLASKLSDDIERVEEGIGSKLGLIVQYVSTFIAGLIVGFYANWRLSLVILGACPIIIAVSSYVALGSSGNAAREQLKYAKAAGVVNQALNAFRTVSAFGGEGREIKKYKIALEEGRKLVMHRYYLLSMGSFAIYFIMYSSYGVAFWYGSILIDNHQASPGSIFTVFFSMLAGVFSLGHCLPFVSAVTTARGSILVLREILDRVPSIDAYSIRGRVLPRLNGSIRFRDVSFTYPARPESQVLTNVNFEIPAGQKVAIVGRSGAGKTTIGQLLLRFYDPILGQIMVDEVNIRELRLSWLRSKIGYVRQEPIVFGMTIDENIRLGSVGATKEDIIRASTLANAHSFITQLPDGYQTEVDGSTLSGGQKQRIAIARALVGDPRIIIMDEATSALDGASEAVVQQAMESAMEGRTSLIIAHRLATVINANIIIVMKDGKVAEIGKYDELISNKGEFNKLLTAQSFGFDSEKPIKTPTSPEIKSPIHMKKSSSSLLSESICSLSDAKRNNKVFRTTKELLRLLKYNSPEWPWLLLCVFSAIIVGTIPPAYSYFYSEMFSTYTLVGEELKYQTLFWSAMLLCLGVISGAAFALMIFSVTTATEKLIARLRLIVFSNMLKQPVETFDLLDFSIGNIITKLSHQLPFIKSASGVRLGHCITTVVTLVAAMIIAFLSGPKLAAFLLIGVPLIIMASSYQYSLIRKNLSRDTEITLKATHVVSESIQNILTVQSLAKEKFFFDKYVEHMEIPYRENKKRGFLFGLCYALSQSVVFAMYAAGFWYGTYLIGTGEMSPSMVYRVFFALSFCATAVGQSSSYLQDFSRAKTAMRLVFQMIDMKSPVDPTCEYGIKPMVTGHVELKGVEFNYPAREDVDVLRGVNLEIPAGSCIALVGPSGAGKSTILNLLLRFYQPTNGYIALDNMDIRAINVRHLRSIMALVPQEPILFDCSIRENISYGASSDISIDEVIRAAKNANIHDFIVSLPKGYDTLCGEKGTQLSGGQKQRIAIARALIRNPKILLLDEATSALDPLNEKALREALENAKKGRTCIIVAHRLSTILMADQIAVLSGGSIAEMGSHDDLMESQGLYYKLISSQLIH